MLKLGRHLIAIVFVFSHLDYANAQPLLSGQELASINAWLESSRASNPDNTIPRAMLLLFQRSFESIDFVTEEQLSSEDTAIALSIRAVQCIHERTLAYCADNRAATEWLMADEDNLPPYLLLMQLALTNEDEETALSYLQQGLNASRVNAYYFERFFLVQEQLRNMRFRSGRRNFVAELVVLPSLQEIYGSLRQSCLARVEQSPQWLDACLGLADKLESGKTFYANVLGAAIRRDVTALTSDDEALIAAAIEQRASYDEVRVVARDALDWWIDPEGRPQSFYRDSLESGELNAIHRAIEQQSAQ